MTDTTLGDHMKGCADTLDRERPERARMHARELLVDIVRYLGQLKGHPFKKACRLFVEHTLPEVATTTDLSGLERILRHAGFGGEANTRITVQMLRDWDREASLPPAETIDISSGWLTAEEYTSLARAYDLPGMPTTVRGMQKYLDAAVARSGNPGQLKRKIA